MIDTALGTRYEVIAEPYEENVSVAGGRTVRRGVLSYEVWARVAAHSVPTRAH
jgi:hypothetical protein